MFDFDPPNQEQLLGVKSDGKRGFLVGSVLDEAVVPGHHFHSSVQAGWAGSVLC